MSLIQKWIVLSHDWRASKVVKECDGVLSQATHQDQLSSFKSICWTPKGALLHDCRNCLQTSNVRLPEFRIRITPLFRTHASVTSSIHNKTSQGTTGCPSCVPGKSTMTDRRHSVLAGNGQRGSRTISLLIDVPKARVDSDRRSGASPRRIALFHLDDGTD